MSTAGETPPSLPPGVGASLLAKAVRVLLGSPDARPIGWRWRSIWEPRVVHTRGVYLLDGAASAAGQERAWSVVLKVLAPTSDGAPPLESFLYGSGLLASLRGGLVAPRCLGVDELPGGDVGVWLEHVVDTTGPAWSVERFGVAARHLGELAGTQTPDGGLPDWPWLRRGQLRGGLAAAAAPVDALRRHLAHPFVRRAYPPDVAESFLRVWDERDTLLAALDRVPAVVCHGDAQRRNLFARDAPGAERTVAVDWTNARAWPVGADAKTLVYQALLYFDADVASVADLDAAAFRGYLQGLRGAGWRGEDAAVRVGYALQMALGNGVGEVAPTLRMALDASRRPRDEAIYGRPVGDILDRRAAIGRFLIGLMEEIRPLL
jgi:hypothetical protein